MVCYLGPPVTPATLLLDPSHGLAEQAWRPRYQTHGTMNADGFGVGWYDRTRSADPALYRRACSIWSDRSFDSIARVVAADAILAAVRSATPPLPVHEFNTPPYAAGQWLFAHNGAIEGFASEAGVALRARVSPARAARIEGSTDSETLFALILDGMDRGAAPTEAMARAVATVESVAPIRPTMLMTDGRRAYALVRDDSMFVRNEPNATTLASEPFGGDEAWTRVPDGSLIEAEAGLVRIRPFDDETEAKETA